VVSLETDGFSLTCQPLSKAREQERSVQKYQFETDPGQEGDPEKKKKIAAVI